MDGHDQVCWIGRVLRWLWYDDSISWPEISILWWDIYWPTSIGQHKLILRVGSELYFFHRPPLPPLRRQEHRTHHVYHLPDVLPTLVKGISSCSAGCPKWGTWPVGLITFVVAFIVGLLPPPSNIGGAHLSIHISFPLSSPFDCHCPPDIISSLQFFGKESAWFHGFRFYSPLSIRLQVVWGFLRLKYWLNSCQVQSMHCNYIGVWLCKNRCTFEAGIEL